MRNKVRLYIGGKLADLDDGSFLLFNYTMEDLSNPTVVKNTFSNQITLKGTPANDDIFGHIHRNDRVTQYGGGNTGPDFDPTRKTSFAVYNEANEILADGYLKLDEVVTKGRRHEYKVTLYGGLGSFLYGLSYDNSGNKRSLADLDFGVNLDFTINRTAVADAWARIGGDTSKSSKWDYINFAPVYGGIPSGEFNAEKAVVHAPTCGLPSASGEYATSDGWTLVTLPQKVTGNEAKDYRSYLQKPLLRVKHLIDAICGSLNNGGYTVNYDAEFFDDNNPYWENTWLTLPMLNKLNIDVTSSTQTLSISSGTVTIPGGGSSNTLYDIELIYDTRSTVTGANYQMHVVDDWAAGTQDDAPGYYVNYLDYWVQAYDSANVLVFNRHFRFSTMDTPDGYQDIDAVFDYIATDGKLMKDGAQFIPTFTVSGYGINSIHVQRTVGTVSWGHMNSGADNTLIWPLNSYDYTDGVTGAFANNSATSSIVVTSTTSSTVRTGASVTQSMLLTSQYTPADYLLSFCKTFGIQIVCHKGEKVVDLILRKNFFDGSSVDLTGRVDRGRDVTKTPFAFDARWYVWGSETSGEYAEWYRNKYGLPFGRYRVNTGYDFNASEQTMTDGIVFRGLCSLVETSKYFCDIEQTGLPVPAVFLSGGKYTLWKGGETKTEDIPLPVVVSKTWDNPSHPMHDDIEKLQLHGKDNAPLDERDTLVFFDFMETPASDHISLTDDTRVMLALNGNAPCWLPGYCDYDAGWKVTQMPRFSRYMWSATTINFQLDWGDPLELQIPGATVGVVSNIYDQYWAKYIADRYDDDSSVVTCWVDLRGLQVGEAMFRSFYRFDGAVWALNRIINYSLTTSGPTECEFVKVQDTTDYTSL